MVVPHRFPGGVHPKEIGNGKASTCGKPVVRAELPERVILPLSQHIGAPCACVVKIGDRVDLGQVIGEAKGTVSAPVHATVSGRVVDITPCMLANGIAIPSVIIDNDFEERWHPGIAPDPALESLSPKELAARVREAGIVGMGGATFPTAVKLEPPVDKPIDTVILNGVECEPYLSADHRLMLERPESVLDGLYWIMKILSAKHAIIGIEQNKPDAIATMRKAVEGQNIDVVDLPLRYPQGGEKQLIYALTGRRVPNGKLPMEVGAMVSNVATAAAVADALRTGRPLVERIMTVAGRVRNPQNMLVRIGTPLENIIEQCGGLEDGVRKMVLGGPMMGIALSRLDIPVIKGTSGLLALGDEAVPEPESPCIRCGRCTRACPMQLQPLVIDAYVRKRDWANAEAAGVMNCIECGACVYACPAKRELTQNCRVGKRMIAANKKKA